jgi:hypothetical protein
MFRASSCPSSGAYQLQQQPLGYRRNVVVALLLVVVGPVVFLQFFGVEVANSVVQADTALSNRHLILLCVLKHSRRQNSIKSCLVEEGVEAVTTRLVIDVI